MASFSAHLFDLGARVLMKRKFKKAVSIEQARATLGGEGRRTLPLPKDVTFTLSSIGGINGEWVRAATPGTATLLYLHGGGYVACSPITHRPITSAYAKLGFDVYAPDYRLAPEHPYPAAVDDAYAVYCALREQTRGPIVISGESAGGGLCLALMLRCLEKNTPLPAAAAVFSPWTDLAATGDSVLSNQKREAMLWGPGIHDGALAYLGSADARTPQASPLYGDFTGFPPVLIHVGDREILRDDSTRLAARLTQFGIENQLRVFPVVSHAWQLANSFMREARESLAEAAAFLHKHAAQAPAAQTFSPVTPPSAEPTTQPLEVETQSPTRQIEI